MKGGFRLKGGFTLIELLVVMAILAILFALVLVAVNPVRQTQQANDLKRRADINTIVNAINQYAADNSGTLPTGITTSLKIIGTTLSACDSTSCAGEFPQASCVDIEGTVAPRYIASMPYDPVTGNSSRTRYGVKKSGTDNRITVKACDPDLASSISVTQ